MTVSPDYRLRLYIYRDGQLVDVVDAIPAAFYSYLPSLLDYYTTTAQTSCRVLARFVDVYGKVVSS